MGRRIVSILISFGVALACGGQSARHEGEPLGGGGTAGAASNSGDDAVACSKNSDCVLVANPCCSCWHTTLEDVVAVNRAHESSYRDGVCASAMSCDGGCVAHPSSDQIATCRDGKCAATDLTETDINSCVTNEDCKAREPRCCGCGVPHGPELVAMGVAGEELYASLLCDPGEACADCAAPIPNDDDHYVMCAIARCVLHVYKE